MADQQTRATTPDASSMPVARAGRRLRVLHVVTHLDMGGAEGVAMGLIDTLRPDIDFALFAVLRDAELNAVGRDLAARLERWRVPYAFGVGGGFKSGGVILAALALVRMAKRFRADVVHLHTEIPELTFAVACALSRRARRMPLLRTVHNCTLWIDWHAIGRGVTSRLAHGTAVAVSRAAADADAAIATARPRPRAGVIYNGVEAPPRVAADAPPSPGPFRLLFAGRLVDQKGADLLPAILAAAHGQVGGQAVDVTIAGTGVMHDAVAQGLAGGLDGWTVRIVPPIERLPERLREYDGVLVPSRFEGFGLLPVEALMAGVPVVTTDAPGLDEVIPAEYPLRTAVADVPALAAQVARMVTDRAACRAIAASYSDALAARFDPAVAGAAYAARYRALAGVAA